jgi:hypothetical protein
MMQRNQITMTVSAMIGYQHSDAVTAGLSVLASGSFQCLVAAVTGFTFTICFAAAVKLLLDMGSDINAQIETNRNTALTLACFQVKIFRQFLPKKMGLFVQWSFLLCINGCNMNGSDNFFLINFVGNFFFHISQSPFFLPSHLRTK